MPFHIPEPSEYTQFAVVMKGIVKQFPSVLANDHVDLYAKEGEIHAIVGENGAGKSTLMNLLYGLYTPDAGKVYIRGKETLIKGPAEAIKAGIGMVHQHFMLVGPLTVAENIVLGEEPLNSWRFFDLKAAKKTGTRTVRNLRASRRCGSAHRGYSGRYPTKSGDSQNVVSGRQYSRSGRTDSRAHTAGGGRVVRGSAEIDRKRENDHLHYT